MGTKSPPHLCKNKGPPKRRQLKVGEERQSDKSSPRRRTLQTKNLEAEELIAKAKEEQEKQEEEEEAEEEGHEEEK